MALGGEVANLIVQLRLDDSGFTGKLNNAGRSLRALERGGVQVGRGMAQVGGGLLRLVDRAAVAAAGGLTAVITTAASFEQAFTGVEKTVDGTDQQLGELEETLRGMARSMPVSFEELAAIGEAGGALGVARESLDEFIDVVARLAVSTDLTSDAAATALGQLGTVLDLTGQDYEDLADSLVALGNAGASTESQIVEMASRFAASGRSAGLTKEEILALASATASMGIEVEAGGTALSQTFDRVALAIGTGSSEAKAFANILGQSAAEFRRNWERDALGTFQNFLRELSKLDQFEQAAALDAVGITGIRQQRAVRLMAQNYGFLNEQLEVSANAQGALREESNKFFDTAQGQWKTFINVVRDGAAIIGEEVLPVTKEILEDLTGGLDNPAMRRRLREFGRDLADGIRSLVRELKGTDFSGLIGGMKLTAEVAKRAFDAFRALPAPVQQLAIAALVANKVSGGAVGQIAKGLGNILLGGGRIGAGLFGRGATPATPVFTKEVGLGGAAGGAGGLLGGRLGGLGKILFGVSAAGMAALMASALEEPLQAAAKEINKGIFGREGGSIFGDFKVNDLQWPFGPKNPPGPRWLQEILGTPSENRPTLESLGGGTAGGALGIGFGRRGTADRGQFRGTVDDIPRVREEIAALRQDNRAYDGAAARRFSSLEQRLIRDRSFARELTPERFMRLLARTSEFGQRGVGTSIERGPTTGKDPFGQAFLALARRLPPEHLKDRQVIGELQRHIVAAEEEQSRLIEAGDIEGARKLQRTIDGIHALLGSQDRNNAIARDQRRVQQETANRIRDTRASIMEQKLALTSGFASSNAKLAGILAKDESTTVNVTTNVNAQISTYDATYVQSIVQTIRNNNQTNFREGL